MKRGDEGGKYVATREEGRLPVQVHVKSKTKEGRKKEELDEVKINLSGRRVFL